MTTDIDTIAILEQRLARLEAERSIQRLMVDYAQALDYGDNVAWADCYTPDGDFDVRRRGEPMFAHAGAAALATFAAGHSSAPTTYHKHFLSLPAIDFVDDHHATATTYFTMLHESPTGPIVLVFGRYLDVLVEVGGRWLFAERVVDMEALPPAAG